MHENFVHPLVHDTPTPAKVGSPFPNAEQLQLLKASLLDREAASQAWAEWKSGHDIMDHLDYGSFRLLPLIYRNFLRTGVDDPAMTRLKGIYLQSWCKNQQLIYETSMVLDSFARNHIPHLVLKGIALSYLFYEDMGVRIMADADVLVPSASAEKAIALLEAAGWAVAEPEHLAFNLRYGKSMNFLNGKGHEIDLHWHPFFESHSPETDQDFWDYAVPLQLGGTHSLALCPEDTLLHIILHGLRWNPDPPIRWIPDAMLVLRTTGNRFRWDRLLAQVRKRRLAIQVREALTYLQTHLQLEVPSEVVQEIATLRVGFAERFVYRNNIREDAESLPEALLPRLRYLFSVYLRQSGHHSLVLQIFGFLRFLLFRTEGKNRLLILWYYLKRKKSPGSSGQHLPTRI